MKMASLIFLVVALLLMAIAVTSYVRLNRTFSSPTATELPVEIEWLASDILKAPAVDPASLQSRLVNVFGAGFLLFVLACLCYALGVRNVDRPAPSD